MAQIQWKQISPYLSGSGNLTGSLNLFGDQTVSGDVTIGGILTAQEYRSELISASILYESGSSLFGNSSDDTHTFTGSVNITGSLSLNDQDISTIVLQGGIFRQTGSFWSTTNDLEVTGSFKTFDGTVSFENYPWPASGEEVHFLKTVPFTSSYGGRIRDYGYGGIALESFDTGSQWYNHSIVIYTYDDHDNPNYGGEINVGPVRTHMRQLASGSDSIANISVNEVAFGSTAALIYADEIQIGQFLGSTIGIGNPSASIEATGSFRLALDGVDQYFSVDINKIPQVKVNEEGVFQVAVKDITPTAVSGGLFYSSSNEYYLGFI